ncbi:MAG TPA: protein kinase [Ktedonobacteraceae bacterium]|nr:protein kinase [Ktedonobacteraceae bacterium]
MQEKQNPLPVGTAIHKHYTVESLFGKGDFGNVYLVRDQRDKQKLFVLAEMIHIDEREQYGFSLEYVSPAPLDRQVLPRVQYAFNDEKLDRAYLLMSYVEEQNLEALRLQQAEKRFPLVEVIRIMTPVVNAIAYLHGLHSPVIHRNIQPASVIVSRTVDEPALAMLDLFTEHGSATTTLDYFAPGYGATEQYKGEFSARTDVYGLGATCYTLLTGIVPPDALSRSTRLSNGETDPLKPVNEIIPDVPILLSEAIQRAMSIDDNDRFSSVEQFREVLVSLASQAAPGLSEELASTSSSPPALLPEQPGTLHVRELDGLQLAASRQADETPAPAPVAAPPHATRVWKPGVLLILLAILISLSAGAGFWFYRQSLPPAHPTTPTPSLIRTSPTSVPAATTAPSIYPALSGTYTGTIYDVSANVTTNISLTSIRQNRVNIAGYLALGPHIQGSGPFRGTIDTSKHVQFIVTDAAGKARLFFDGVMQSATNLSGDYYSCSPAGTPQGSQCSRIPGSYGIWSVALA